MSRSSLSFFCERDVFLLLDTVKMSRLDQRSLQNGRQNPIQLSMNDTYMTLGRAKLLDWIPIAIWPRLSSTDCIRNSFSLHSVYNLYRYLGPRPLPPPTTLPHRFQPRTERLGLNLQRYSRIRDPWSSEFQWKVHYLWREVLSVT